MPAKPYTRRVLLAALLLAGCGSATPASRAPSAGTTQPTPSATVAPPATASGGSGPLALTDRVIRPGELAGLDPSAAPAIVRGAASWVAAEGLSGGARSAELARLRRVGFDSGVAEQLGGTAGTTDRNGLSLVERLGSAQAARLELALNSNPRSSQASFASFGVPGIPGARGFDASGSGGAGHNVAFADGRFYYLVGVGFAIGTSNPPTRAQVVAAATSLYQRVHGRANG